MKITKFLHACLLVEMPAPVNRTTLFDPGIMSVDALDISQLIYLDDIVITHAHPDHYHLPLIRQLVAKFPDVRITAPKEVTADLHDNGISQASQDVPEGMTLFSAPHENVAPLYPKPDQIGVHYLDLLTHPGDSHSFKETKRILALPVTGPWASTVVAVNLALRLKPEVILPIHDWHWSDAAREQLYDQMAEQFATQGIDFKKLETGQPIVIDT